MKKIIAFLFVLQIIVIPQIKWNRMTEAERFDYVEGLAVDWAKKNNCRHVGVVLEDKGDIEINLNCKDTGVC